VQQAFYNGWKKFHGTKNQLLELPNGMCADFFGPLSFRRSDLDAVEESEINEKMEEVQFGQDKQYVLYGDRIYVLASHIRRAHVGDEEDLTPEERCESRVVTKVRIAAEWDFGVTCKIFKFTQFWHKVQLKKHENHRMYYFVATFLRNLHVCLYGTITSKYFKCRPPSIQEYLS
jgi:hypothetical protein